MCRFFTSSLLKARSASLETQLQLVLSHVALTGSRVAAAMILLQRGADALWLGGLMALFALPPLLGSRLAGRWVDRGGHGLALRLGLLASALGLLLAATWDSASALAVMALLVGAGHGLASLSLQATLITWPARLALLLGISGGLGPWLAGIALSLGTAVACGLLASLPLAALLLSAPDRLEERTSVLSDPVPSQPSLMTLLGSPRLRRTLLLDLLVATFAQANALLLPLQAQRLEWSTVQVGQLISASAASMVFARLLPVPPRPALIAVTAAATGLCFAFYGEAVSPAQALVLQLALGVSLGLAFPALLTWLMRDAPKHQRAEVLGARASLLHLGALLLPPILAVAYQRLGLSLLAMVLAGLAWLAATVLAIDLLREAQSARIS